MSPAHDIALYIAANTALVFGDTIHVSREPVQPRNVVTVYDTGGPAPILFDENLRNPTIQVRVRNDSYTDAYQQQEQICELLSIDNTSFETTGYRYVGCWLTSDIISIGRNENDRHLLTANYELQRHPKEA